MEWHLAKVVSDQETLWLMPGVAREEIIAILLSPWG
jgi:hypothetical protein